MMKKSKAIATTELPPISSGVNKKKFTYEPAMVKASSVMVHPLLEIIGYDIPDDIYLEWTSQFTYYERSVITEDGYAITHPTDILAAQQNGVDEIEVVVMKEAMLNDVIDFISFKNVWKHGKSRRKIYEMVKFLTSYVKQQDKEWKTKFKSTKTRSIVAEIAGVSDGSIQNIVTIGNKDPELLDKIDNKETTSSQVISMVKPPSKPINTENDFESRKRYANLIISNNPIVGNGEEAQLKVKNMKLEVENIGLIEFVIDKNGARLFINGQFISSTYHNVVSDQDYEGEREYSQHHTLLPNDDAFDVQFILKGLEKFIAYPDKKAA